MTIMMYMMIMIMRMGMIMIIMMMVSVMMMILMKTPLSGFNTGCLVSALFDLLLQPIAVGQLLIIMMMIRRL